MMCPRNLHSLPVPPRCSQQSSMGTSAPENSGCSLQNILLEQVYNLLPPIPFTSQGDQLGLQCEARDKPLSQWLTNNRTSLSSNTTTTTFPVLYLSKYRAHQSGPTHTNTTKPIHPPVTCKGVQPAATILPSPSPLQTVSKWVSHCRHNHRPGLQYDTHPSPKHDRLHL
jgi:hypothetical protein